MSGSLEVVRPGPLTTIQDLGRPGYAALGVTTSGAADRHSFARGAALVGNPLAAAALEGLLGGMVFRVRESAAFLALSGATAELAIDGRPQPPGVAVWAQPGQVITVGMATSGLRVYLSVRGGIAVPAVLGSRSRDTLSGIGPAPLRADDILPIGELTGRVAAPEPSSDLTVQVLPGPRTAWLRDASALAGEWQISPRSDRVGVRLLGDRLQTRFPGRELPSEAVVRGSIQLPPGGEPVIFGADHPTTGGYPVVGVLTAQASDQVAQRRPGEVIHLVWA